MLRTLLLGVALACLLTPTAEAAKRHSFDGRCALTGHATVTPAVVIALQPGRVSMTGGGTCTGRLDGKDVQDAPVTVGAEIDGQFACVNTFGQGVGKLRFERGKKDAVLDLRVEMPGHPLLSRVHGARGGSALSPALFTATDEPLTDCPGSGIRGVDYTINLQTLSPLRD